MKDKNDQAKRVPKPKFTNPLISEQFLKDWWRRQIKTANNKEPKSG